jgi:hypothetical protein
MNPPDGQSGGFNIHNYFSVQVLVKLNTILLVSNRFQPGQGGNED